MVTHLYNDFHQPVSNINRSKWRTQSHSYSGSRRSPMAPFDSGMPRASCSLVFLLLLCFRISNDGYLRFRMDFTWDLGNDVGF